MELYKYHSMNRISQTRERNNLLGREIYWTEKEDGSNCRIYLSEDNKLLVGSRNQEIAEEDFSSRFMALPVAKNIEEFLLEERNIYNEEYIVFGEMCLTGKSPAHVKIHEKDKFVMFDIFDRTTNEFLHYNKVHQISHQFDIALVPCYLISISNSIDDLYKVRDRALELSKEAKSEGVVGKCIGKEIGKWDGEKCRNYLYFKEKHDMVHIDKIPRSTDENKLSLPILEDSEIYGAIDKVKVDLSKEDFSNPRIAMPLISKAVQEELKKHRCTLGKEKKIFDYYKNTLEE